MGAGLVYTGLLPGGDEDVIGLGLSVPINGDTYQEAQRIAGAPADRQEIAIELAYRMQIARWMGLQFGAQYIVNPGTGPTLDDVGIVGMRTSFVF